MSLLREETTVWAALRGDVRSWWLWRRGDWDSVVRETDCPCGNLAYPQLPGIPTLREAKFNGGVEHHCPLETRRRGAQPPAIPSA